MSLYERLSGPAVAEPEEPSAKSGLQERIGAPLDVAEMADSIADLKLRIHRECITKLGPELFARPAAEQAQRVHEAVEQLLAADETPLARDERARLVREVVDDVIGYGPLQPLLHDDSVSEIMVNGPRAVYVERNGKIELTSTTFTGDAHLLRIIDKIVSQVGRRVDESSPMVDARLPDGSRVNAILPPLALGGATMTIRKFSRDPHTIDDLVAFGTLTRPAAEFLSACVRGKMNVLISGGAGVGKTTLLNALSAFVPEAERIITIEDAAELQLQQRHVVRLESRPANVEGQGEITIRDLVRNALRMRPDRLIVGEVRGAETLDMLQAMNTGHEGSLTTVHANSTRDALARIETLVLTGGVDLPLRAVRDQIASAFDVVIQLTRLANGSRRITHIAEISGMESDVITMQNLFTSPAATGDGVLAPLQGTGIQPHFLGKLAAHGVSLPDGFFLDAADTELRLRAVGGRA